MVSELNGHSVVLLELIHDQECKCNFNNQCVCEMVSSMVLIDIFSQFFGLGVAGFAESKNLGFRSQ